MAIWLWAHGGACSTKSELLMRCAAASAADSVFVITKSVAANPIRTRTPIFPFQPLTSRSIIPIEPTPSGVWPAT